ncbi:c-type cytochrome [Halomonas sp. ANAO-440]|uniref:c-type cytochrome n=1 Tax=Halomonas sp. ANAO-440 TaxID=2861360 RepID=UPI001CAA79A0|nr:c-type cytochrome [Halomonas sp. ANAO-440]MBZ0329993.1 c-type cytochrome [Halomonas sp. ANAO-440]
MHRPRARSGRLGLALATLLLAPLAANATEHAEGERLFRAQCVGCHSIEPGRHLAGPSLHDLIGRPAGSIEEFDYSPALEQADLVWNRDTLDAFLAGPEALLPGNRMVLWELDERTRRRIIDYLEYRSLESQNQESQDTP